MSVPKTTAQAGSAHDALHAWMEDLRAAGVLAVDGALTGPAFDAEVPFASDDEALDDAWHEATSASVLSERMVIFGEGASARALVVVPVLLGGELGGWISLVVMPPTPDRLGPMVRVMSSSLLVKLQSLDPRDGRSAAQIIELLAWVSSQPNSRTAAQEWINRTAALLRSYPFRREALEESQPKPHPAAAQLTLFSVAHGEPKWWVSADTSWVDQATPAIQRAAELAARCVNESAEVVEGDWRALPSQASGETVSVLVLRRDSQACASSEELDLLRASFALGEPLLRQWRTSDQPLWRHHVGAARRVWSRLWGPGHLAWKATAMALVLGLGVLLLWPVPDRVTASTSIEGLVRQVVTAPFDGFIARSHVRPGEAVQEGQLLLALDDRDLKLDLARYTSEREQASGKLRQAMAEREASAVALASAAVQQAEAQLNLINAKLARSQLRAPLAGLVVSGDWSQRIGSPVEAGKELFEIAAGSGFRVVLHVADRDITRVKSDQAGTLRLAGQPQIAHRFRVATITATAGVVDSVNGFRVEANWLGEPPPLSPGMQGVGKIEVGTSNLITIWTRPSIDWLRLKLWAWWG